MSFRRPRVLLLGDLMLDVWMRVEPRDLNPEGAAVIMTGDRGTRDETPGGAGLVAVLMSSIGLRVKMMSRVGAYPADSIAYMLLHEAGVSCKSVASSPTYQMPLKFRYVNDHGVVVFRYDEETSTADYLNDNSADFKFDRYNRFAQRADCVVIADYGKGYCQDFGPKIIEAAKYYGALTVVGAKPSLLHKYAGADVIKVNRGEAEAFLGCNLSRADNAAVAKQLASELTAAAAIVTSGSGGCGIAVRNADAQFDIFDAPAAPCFPVIKNCVGAGDAFLAGLVYELVRTPKLQSAGFSGLPLDATRLQCAVAAAAATAAQFLERGYPEVDEAAPFLASRARLAELDPLTKVLTREEAQAMCSAWRGVRENVVFTNGCFDLLHPGHVHLLSQARKQGDRLIVALNTDESVRQLKGTSRPVQDFDSRAALLAGLSCVDAIVPLDELDGEAQSELRGMLTSFAPDVLVKGAQYAESEIVGWEEVVNRDPPGRVWRCPMLDNCSTTQLIEKVQNGKQ